MPLPRLSRLASAPARAGSGARDMAARAVARFDAYKWLAAYMRALALVFLVAGVLHWIALLTMPTDPVTPFASLSKVERAVTIAFAVLDPVAAVGLWLVSAWGAVIWILLAVARMVLTSGMVEDMRADRLVAGFHGASVLVYLALTALAARQEEA